MWRRASRRTGTLSFVRVSHRKSFAGQAAFSNPPCPLPIVQRRGRPIGIGVLMGYPENDVEGPAFFAAFREGLEKLGWVEDRNIRFYPRGATPEDAGGV